MPTGRVATVSPNASTLTQLYYVNSGYYGIYNISITNTNSTPVTIRLAVTNVSPTAPNPNEYIEFGAVIVPNGVLERTGVAIQAGYYLSCYATSANVNFNVWGIETLSS